uniref:Uncharacterized protein n=1 Tax=Physcomitrium patens TaxID=3218 RepID=A0A2K1L6V7_PHYPA|nr:hypothetical protein PHYPA_000165 [Physcomitrium patens]
MTPLLASVTQLLDHEPSFGASFTADLDGRRSLAGIQFLPVSPLYCCLSLCCFTDGIFFPKHGNGYKHSRIFRIGATTHDPDYV